MAELQNNVGEVYGSYSDDYEDDQEDAPGPAPVVAERPKPEIRKGRPPSVLAPGVVDEMAGLYRSGASKQSLANHYGVGVQRVTSELKRLGVHRVSAPRNPQRPRTLVETVVSGGYAATKPLPSQNVPVDYLEKRRDVARKRAAAKAAAREQVARDAAATEMLAPSAPRRLRRRVDPLVGAESSARIDVLEGALAAGVDDTDSVDELLTLVTRKVAAGAMTGAERRAILALIDEKALESEPVIAPEPTPAPPPSPVSGLDSLLGGKRSRKRR